MTAHPRAAGRSISVVVLASAMVVGACHKKPEVAPAPAPIPQAAPAVDSSAIRDSIARAQAARDAALARQRAYDDSVRRANEAAAAAGEQTGLRNTITAVIHFDFDKSDLRDDSRATLDAKVPVLTANPEVTIRIAGHTDERGSVEYNIALGQRRAASAKRYLTERGIAATRIETISYGEGRPVSDGHDENAWAQNRRDEFEITAGGTHLNKPGS